MAEPSSQTDLESATTYLHGRASLDPEAVLQLANRLEEQRQLRHARLVLHRARRRLPRGDPLDLVMAQQQASCTYRDERLPQRRRLEAALRVLVEADDPQVSRDQRTLGLAGAIEKRFWKLNGHPKHLHRALAYYLRGARLGIASDRGYTAINAAYTLDHLALLARHQAGGAELELGEGRDYSARAELLRIKITGELPPILDSVVGSARWWVLATLAEAHFGLGEYERAAERIRQAMEVPAIPEWQRETTARQLAGLTVLRDGSADQEVDVDEGVVSVLRALVDDYRPCIDSIRVGKVGLALSGGGFRASLFHLGVLARLAELDVLRHVQILSCVSGGSIVGAHYYLELKKLLETVPDAEITRGHYVEVVRRVTRAFLEGVQRNVRMRVLAEFTTNLKMGLLPHYSRTLRVGELYEREIYSRVADGRGGAARYIDDLVIRPAGEAASFRAEAGNWRRRARIPSLIINATTLNTGHNWQFTTAWMGEPPSDTDADIDGNERLRRIAYPEAPHEYRRLRLGHAVAASSCVPGLFEPLELPRLYTQRVVRLVDGGVHDNQGISALLDGECTTILVSDASGQMVTQRNPGGGLLSVVRRSNDILMARVRQEQHQELESRRRSGLLRGVFFVHLKRGLVVDPVDWKGCPDPYPSAIDEIAEANGGPTMLPYGIPAKIQRRLAAIRTDLDSFCDAEAHALMLSGYRMADHDLAQSLPFMIPEEDVRVEWEFLAIEPVLREAAESPATPMARILEAAPARAFRVWKLIPSLNIVTLLLTAGVMFALWRWAGSGVVDAVLRVEPMLYTAGLIVAVTIVLVVLRFVPVLATYWKALSNILIASAMLLGGFILARFQLHLLDPLYLAYGSAHRLYVRPGGPTRPARRWFEFTSLRRRSAANEQGLPATTGKPD